MFWGWVHGQLNSSIQISPELHDIQRLNRIALEQGRLEFTKISMATFLDETVRSRYRLLSSGAALGRGCGPLVVSKKQWSSDAPTPIKLAIPGRNTTACKLAEMSLGKHVTEWVELRYDQIMPAVIDGKVDAGVIIHESRFVYAELGLKLAFDLGEWWESETGLPLPLGLMVAQSDLDEQLVSEVEKNLRDSIVLARSVLDNGAETPNLSSLWDYLRENAIEIEDHTMLSHIDLYVNNFSVELGTEGREAVEEFQRRAESCQSLRGL